MGSKATTVVTPSNRAGQPTILGISSITQQGKTFMKTIPVSSTMAKTLSTQAVGAGGSKQPTMITVTTKMMTGTTGTPTKIITASMPKPQIVITTQAGAQGTIVSGAVRGSVATAAKTGAPITIIRAVTPQGAGQLGGSTKTIQIITKGDGKQQTSASILKALQNTPGLSGATSFTITTTTNTAGVTTKLVTIPISATRPGGLFSVSTPSTATSTTVAQVVANTAALSRPLMTTTRPISATSIVGSTGATPMISTQVMKPGQMMVTQQGTVVPGTVKGRPSYK